MCQSRPRSAALALLMAAFAPLCHASPASTFVHLHDIALGGEGKWDYANIDVSHQRLYVTHGNQVQVVDLNTGSQVGAIADTEGAHGIDFAPELNLGFTSNGRADSVTVFALDSMKVQQQVKVNGKNPDAILYVPQSHQLYTFNGKSNDITVFDVPSMRIVRTIQAGGRPEFAVHDGANRVYFNLEDKNEIGVIDTAAGKVIAHWPLSQCEEPTGLALDRAHARLISACANKVAVVTDAHDGRRIADFAIGTHPDAVVYDAKSGTVLVSNGDSATMTVARQLTPDQYKVEASVATAKGAKTMAYAPATQQVYLPAAVNGGFKILVLGPAAR